MSSKFSPFRTIISAFGVMFTFITLVNDIFTALGFEGFYMSNMAKYIAASFIAIGLYYLKKKQV